MKYLLNKTFKTWVGFNVTASHVSAAVELTNNILSDLPASLYRSVDFKTTSSVVGSVLCDLLARETGSIVNPIEKGHPDLVPLAAQRATEEQLRNYPDGLEIKCTIGGVEQGANLRAGVQRVAHLSGITWQAHHREVSALMGVTWDFASDEADFQFPVVTGVFYADSLTMSDWGNISGTSGRNTKVCGLRSSGKAKLGSGWIMVLDSHQYKTAFTRLLGCVFDQAISGVAVKRSVVTRAPASRE